MTRHRKKSSPQYVKSAMNQARALRAMAALQTYGRETGQNLVVESDDAIGDLLCDLGHLCVAKGLNYDLLMARGRDNFALEATGCEF